MTLDTRIYIQDRVDYREVFLKCNQLIGAHEGVAFTDDPGEISNLPGQGLPGWLIINHGDGCALRKPGDHAAYCDGAEDDCYAPCGVPCWLEVSLDDTSYSYSGPEGGCGDLHARVVAELGHWLDAKSVRWSWLNDFTGEVHSGYEGLEELGMGGLRALEWFEFDVKPAITAKLADQ